jgi:hypothetical protein
MILFSEKGTLRHELADVLSHVEEKVAHMGMHPDELVSFFHHNDVAHPAQDTLTLHALSRSRRSILQQHETAASPSSLFIIR